jgi:hypothetical protein
MLTNGTIALSKLVNSSSNKGGILISDPTTGQITNSSSILTSVLNRITALEQAGTSSELPVGSIIYSTLTSMPGYLLCDGTTYNIADYTSLINLTTKTIGTVTLTLNLPCIITPPAGFLNLFAEGDYCHFTTTGALPSGITANVSYIISLNDATTIKISSAYSNFINNIFVGTVG